MSRLNPNPPVPKSRRPKPPLQTPGDQLLAGAYCCEVNLFLMEDPFGGDPTIESNFTLHGSLPPDGDGSDLLVKLLDRFARPRREGGVA
jgi:hypothetical protein